MVKTDGGQVMPWEEEQVFSFPDRKDWVFWIAAVDEVGVSEVAAAVPGGAGNPTIIGAVEALTKDALAESHAWWGVGLWCPEDQQHNPCGGALVRTYKNRGDYKKAFKKALKQAKKIPFIPGVAISSYDWAHSEVDLGPYVVREIDVIDPSGAVRLITRVNIFSPAKDEVVEIEFQTVHAHLVDRLTDEGAELISRAFYRVSQEWLDEHGPNGSSVK